MTDRVIKLVLRGDTTGAVAGMRAYGVAVKDTTLAITASNARGKEFQKGLTSLGTSAGKVGLVAAIGLGAIIKSAADFDSAMSRVDAATHESADNMDRLRAAAIKAGADTVFSATEAADAVTALSKAGVSTKDILSGGLDASLSLASAGELDVATAADIAATALNQFGLKGSDANHVADLLAAGAGKAQGEVTDMANALKYVGPVAHQMGISIDETTGTIAELASQGILGEQAGTSLRGVLSSLTSPSKAASTEMEKLGINLYDATGKFVGLKGVAGQLQDTMGDLTNKERDQALGRIFGNEQVTAARILYAGGATDVEKWTKAVDANGYAADTASRKMNNLAGDFEQLKGSLSTLLITSGDGAQGLLRKLTEGATASVNALNELPAPLKSTAVNMLAITAITGGGLWFGSRVVRSISETRDALANLGVASSSTRTALSNLSTGVKFGALVAGISVVSNLVDGLNKGINETDLNRNLEAFASGLPVSDFDKISKDIAVATSGFKKSTEFISEVGAFPSGLLHGSLNGDTELDKAQSQIEKLDQALASLVESGNADEAAKAYKRFSDAALADHGAAPSDTKRLFDAYSTSLKNAGNEADSAAKKSVMLADGTKMVGTQSEIAAAKMQLTDAQLKALQTSADQTAKKFFGMGKEVNNSKVSLDGWIEDLNKQANALRDFTKNAAQAQSKGLSNELLQELELAGPEGALRLKQLADATPKEIAKANKAWASGARAVENYRNLVTGIPPVKIDADTSKAVAKVDGLISVLRFKVNHAGLVVPIQPVVKPGIPAGTTGKHGGDALSELLGGFHADGGRITGPGGPRDDLIPAWLSNGEFVMPADAVQHYGIGVMEGMRAKRLAEGGGVGGRVGLNAYIRSDLDMKAPTTLKQWNEALKASTALLAKEKNQRQALVDQADDVKASITSKYKSDLFGQSTPSIWMSAAERQAAGTGDPIASLSGDIGNLKALSAATKTLKAKGLDGAALADLLGNASLSEVQAFAGGSKAQVQQYEHLYNQRAGLIAATGNLGAQAAFGAQLAVSKAAVTESRKNTAALNRVESLLKKNPHATAVELARAINGAAPKRRS